MNAAKAPRADPLAARLLCVDPRDGSLAHVAVRDLPSRLRAGDLLVVNDAATLPASLAARGPTGRPVELRLTGPGEAGRFTAVLLGEGDWRRPTEHRPAPLPVGEGDVLTIGSDLHARVTRVRPESPRLVEIAFDRDGAALWSALYRHGRPVQYSYLERPLALWDVQTAYAVRPWAAETPSAGRPLTWGLLAALRAAGVRTAAVTHAAGLSSTGDPAIDALLPLPERYEVPPETAAAVRRTRSCGGRVVAVGTTVVRALESAADGHAPSSGLTRLVIDSAFVPRVVDGVLTGLHEPGSSHFALLTAFAPAALLDAALHAAEADGYLSHEFGDSLLVLPGRVTPRPAPRSA